MLYEGKCTDWQLPPDVTGLHALTPFWLSPHMSVARKRRVLLSVDMLSFCSTCLRVLSILRIAFWIWLSCGLFKFIHEVLVRLAMYSAWNCFSRAACKNSETGASCGKPCHQHWAVGWGEPGSLVPVASNFQAFSSQLVWWTLVMQVQEFICSRNFRRPCFCIWLPPVCISTVLISSLSKELYSLVLHSRDKVSTVVNLCW